MRAYCWRVGAVLDIEAGERCPECGSPGHEPYPGDDCGDYVSGSHCALPRRHDGDHSATREAVVQGVMES